LAVIAAALWLAAPIAAHSAGLGRLTVLSALGRPLNAEIELVTAPGDQDIVARLPSPEAFSRAGIEMSPVLIGVRFSIERRNGRQVLRVTTTQPVNEPFLDLLVDLQWNSGRLLREYTVLLDPPEFKRQAIAAAPPPPKPAAPAPAASAPAPTAEAKPAPAPVESKPAPVEAKPAPVEAKPLPPEAAPAAPVAAAPAEKPEAAKPAAEPGEKPAAAPAPMGEATHEVQKGETLGGIAKRNLPPGVSLNQMLIAIYRANEDAFINGNINLVRAGRILNIPDIDAVGTVDAEAANRLVSEHHAQFNDYRSRLAEVPAAAEAAAGQRDAAGRIEPKPEAIPPAKPQDQVRLSKADPDKPATPGARAAREDDQVARQRELQEAQSRVAELEKNVSDLQKLLEMKNQQLAELEKKAGTQAAAPSAAPVPPPAKPAAKAPEQPAAKAPEAPKPAAPAPAPAQPQAPKPPAAAQPAPPKPAASAPPPAKPAPAPAAKAPVKPKPRPAAPPPPEPSLLDELLAPFEDPMLLGGLGLVLLGLIGYAVFVWRRKKAAQAKFQDSVLGAAAAGAVAGTAEPGPTVQPAAAQASPSQAPAGMEAEEVDPIAEADVYIAYGRDAQAEQILKEALQKDSRRTAVHAKLLEIYAARKDTKSFEQTALKVKELAGGGPEWDKACALGRSIDPQNGLYGSVEPSAAPVAAPAAAAAAPTLDFDLGGASQNPTAAPDISLDDTPKEPSASDVDINLITTSMPAVGGAAAEQEKTVTSMDFNLDLGGEKKEEPAAAEPAPAAEPSSGLDFDLKLDDLPSDKPEEKSVPPVDLGSISLDLGTPADAAAAAGSTDPKWQEVATKLDLAKAYEEMGDKNGARELLNEVMKDGDSAQKGQAEQLLAKLG
jgi:pilus assembly protein FimV